MWGDVLIFVYMVLNIFLIVFGTYVLGVLTYGFLRSDTIKILIYFKPLSLPFFRLGVSYERAVFQDGEIDTFSLGLFFVNMDIDFEKNYNDNTAQSDDTSL